MRFTFDLSVSQSSRVIDQAIRHQAHVVLEPRAWVDQSPLTVAIRGGEDGALSTENTSADGRSLGGLIGMHVDARMALGQTYYLFDTHVLDVDLSRTPSTILIARPPTLQIAQRRRFQRKTLQSACTVRLIPSRRTGNHPVTGQLLNLSADGMACRLHRAAADAIHVGDGVRLVFHPEDSDLPFEFNAVLCNKSQAGSQEHVILGLQFMIGRDDAAAQAVSQRLCEFLYAPCEPAMAQGGE